MTVFIAHAPADGAAAVELEQLLERRGHFAEADDGEAALRPVEASDVVILLLSRNFAACEARLRLGQRALDAWAAAKLVLVKLDASPAPLGFRDLTAIDAADLGAREAAWGLVAAAAQQTFKIMARPQGPNTAPAPNLLSVIALAVPGLLALGAMASIWLVNRIGPTPGDWADLQAGINRFGAGLGVPAGVTPWLFALAIVASVAGPAWYFAARRSRGRDAAASPRRGKAVFVACAPSDAAQVAALIEEAGARGRWFDFGDPSAAAPAIASADMVLLFCSRAAFDSDQVKRALHLADRNNKRVLPVHLEAAAAPEDFDYFLAGARRLDLYKLGEEARGAALADALEAAPDPAALRA
jgi:hypothetical protein